MNDVLTEPLNEQGPSNELETLQGEFVDIENVSHSEAACSGACQSGTCIPQ